MANIIQIQDDLKNVSDQDLVNFVKRPTGQVPSYLALGEIKRRKETRDKYQGEKAQQKSTVAEDLVAEQGIGNQMTRNPMSQPTAGVGTPQPQEPLNPAMLASKGIGQLNPGAVKEMNDGGIVGYAAGDLVEGQEAGDLLQQLQLQKAKQRYGLTDYQQNMPDEDYLKSYLERLNEPKTVEKGQPGYLDNSNFMSAVGDDTTKSIVNMSENPILNENVFNRDPGTDNTKPQEFVGTSMNVDETIKSTDDVVDGTVESLTKESITEDIDTVDSKLDVADLELPDLLSKEQQALFADRDSKRPTGLSSEDALKQVLETNKAAGLFDNPFDQDRKDLEKERDLLDKAKSDAGSMAFIQAGLLWMQKGNLGDAAPAVTEYAQALKGLRGEDRELKKMDLALRGADIAFKQGNVKAASDLTAAAEKRLDTFDRDTFTNMQQAMTQGLANRINIQKAQISRQTNLDVAGIQAGKLGAKAEMFEILSTSPAYQKEDGSVDSEKIMKAITPPSSMYAANSKPAQFMAQWNTTVTDLSANPEMEDRLNAFLEKYPDPVAFANAMGAGSSMGSYTTKGGYKPAGR